jgi:hypothetical protein
VGLVWSEGVADAVGDAAVVEPREAVHRERRAGDVAAEALSSDVVAGRDAHAGVDVEAGVLRGPAARAGAGRQVVGLGGGTVLGLELSGAQGQGAAGFERGGVRRLVASLAGQPVVAHEAHPGQALQHAAADGLDDPAQLGGGRRGHTMEADVAGPSAGSGQAGTTDKEAVGGEDMKVRREIQGAAEATDRLRPGALGRRGARHGSRWPSIRGSVKRCVFAGDSDRGPCGWRAPTAV